MTTTAPHYASVKSDDPAWFQNSCQALSSPLALRNAGAGAAGRATAAGRFAAGLNAFTVAVGFVTTARLDVAAMLVALLDDAPGTAA